LKFFLRYAKRTVAGVIALLLTAWIILWAYLSLNKKGIAEKIKTELQKKTSATVSIGEVGVSFLHTFPFISLQLSKVVVRDSLWATHKHDLLNVEKIYAQINPFKILFGKSPFRKVVVEDGTFYLFTDSSGYSNIDIFRKQEKPDEKENEGYPDIAANNMEFIVEKQLHHKLFDFKIYQLSSSVKKSNHVLLFDADLNLFVRDMIFSRKNGSFLHEKKISGNCFVEYSLKSKILSFHDITLNMDEHPFSLSGKFFTKLNPAPFELAIKTNNIDYKQTVAFLSDNLRKKLDQYNIDKPITLSATLDGSDPLPPSPVIHLSINANNAGVTTPFESFTNCSFDGNFFNRIDSTKLAEDENSILRFNNFSGISENIKLQSDSIIFVNLVQPALTCNIRSTFGLESLNTILESKDIDFGKGTAKLDIVYKGPIESGDSINADINGNISFDSASIKYMPKNFLLSSCSGKLVFQNKNLLIEHLNARTGSTELKMNGGIKSLMSLIDKSPDKLFLDWNIFSPKINLHDFKAFMGKKANSSSSTSSNKKSKKIFSKQVSQMDSLLSACDVHLQVKANALEYKKFQATNIKAAVVLKNNTIIFDSVSLNHANGFVMLSGFVKSEETNNSMNIHTVINNVDIDKMLFSFENFGQDAIDEKNIRGKLKADVNFVGSMNNKQEVVPGSIDGHVEFSLKNGELINFEPVESISKKVFKDRNFSDVRFAELKDRFDIKGSAIKINRMEIESTVITLFVEGIYDTKKGTDMSIQIPLSNLKARSDDTIPAIRGVNSKTGLSVRLRAKTGGDGKLKITWDPFKKALKDMKKTEEENASK
jgi:AsmA-like protein